MTEEETKLLGLEPLTKKLPENPIAADVQFLHSHGHTEVLEQWIIDELMARSATRVKEVLKTLPLVKGISNNPDILLINEILKNMTPVARTSPKGRSASYWEHIKRKYTVAAVLAVKSLGIRGDEAFRVAAEYLESVGVIMSPDIVRKNFTSWRGGATPHSTFMSYWRSEVEKFIRPFLEDAKKGRR